MTVIRVSLLRDRVCILSSKLPDYDAAIQSEWVNGSVGGIDTTVFAKAIGLYPRPRCLGPPCRSGCGSFKLHSSLSTERHLVVRLISQVHIQTSLHNAIISEFSQTLSACVHNEPL